ncbi:hypothetical protein BXY66_4092 [Shimia isoporae]|uniref:Uncharacterized protein n=1 Tax=Shimia isoporae TaxID=647720 RepID=A0A4R1N1L7_9RHOB|nr:hypothetical protein BXY66_4092 [Shimia isoporae]
MEHASLGVKSAMPAVLRNAPVNDSLPGLLRVGRQNAFEPSCPFSNPNLHLLQ